MSDHRRLDLKGVFDVYQSTLRLIGAANATGAITAGAAFHALDKTPEAQQFIKVEALIFLMGVLFFAASYAGLFIALAQINNYLAATQTTERTEWEKIFIGPAKDTPDKYLSEAKTSWIGAVLFGLCSFALFMAGLLFVLFVVLVNLFHAA
jgi:hypothetical protein